MLELQYKEQNQVIEISLSEQREFWPTIRTVFQENAEDITSIGAYSLRLPVWAFFSCRRALAYVLRKHHIDFRADDKVKEILNKASHNEQTYRQISQMPHISEEQLLEKLKQEGFYRRLSLEQIRNILKIASLPSAATFSVPGAGKTTEAIAFYCYKRTPLSKLLVVCPKNAFAAWEEQALKCIRPLPKVVRLSGGERNIKARLAAHADIFLITYQQLTNVKTFIADYMLKHDTFMFLDESHHIKRGINGLQGSTVLSLAHLPIAKLIMTGTPMPNSPSDLVPQLNFIYPELDSETGEVASLIRPVFVRTTKRELDLPEVKRVRKIVQLYPQQKHLYELLRSEEARQLASISARDRNQLRQIGRSVIRLLQLVSNPALLLKDYTLFPDELFDALSESDSPKIEYACLKARKLAKQGLKVIIWSNYVENVETIADRLRDIGADFIHGGVEAGSEEEENTRENKIARFHNDPNAYVLVANPAACAEGISLHAVCHHAIYVDRNYNAAQYLQSEDRIHRFGLDRNILTTIEILHTPDTVDESVSRRLELKVRKMADVLDDDSLHIEPVDIDLDADGINGDDAQDFLAHLQRA